MLLEYPSSSNCRLDIRFINESLCEQLESGEQSTPFPNDKLNLGIDILVNEQAEIIKLIFDYEMKCRMI